MIQQASEYGSYTSFYMVRSRYRSFKNYVKCKNARGNSYITKRENIKTVKKDPINRYIIIVKVYFSPEYDPGVFRSLPVS